MPDSRTTRSRRRPASPAPPSAPRWHARAAVWSKPMDREVSTSVSHVDEGTLHAYLDGELPGAERAQLETHLAGCTTCRDRLAEERGLLERADRLLTLAELPAGHTHRPAPAPMLAVRRRPRFVVPAAWAASIALAFVTGWLLRPTPQRAGNAADETKQIAAAVPADSTASAARQNAAAPAMVYHAPVAPRRAAKTSQDSAALQSQSLAVVAETSVVPIVKPGVVENAGRPALRGAAPAPIPPATVAITPSTAAPQTAATADMAVGSAERRAIGTTWTAIAAEPARRALGTDVASIPGIPVRDILQNPKVPNEVMVEQEVADGTIIQLLQSPLDSAVEAMGYGYSRNPLQKAVGRLQVRISGPLAPDSLLKLLDRVR